MWPQGAPQARPAPWDSCCRAAHCRTRESVSQRTKPTAALDVQLCTQPTARTCTVLGLLSALGDGFWYGDRQEGAAASFGRTVAARLSAAVGIGGTASQRSGNGRGL